jgi:hypothetical protein
MKTTAEMIEVMQAFERGEEIQAREIFSESEDWLAVINQPSYKWNLERYDYRIKPREPRVIWVNEYEHGEHAVHDSRESAEERACNAQRVAVKYVEAIE